jgi:peptidoglycan/LPS O-acetylase OafA/YrhL
MTEHYEELDGLRGLAAQVVLIAHANGLILAEPKPLLGWLARMAVVFFFVLSGFAIATTIKRHSLADGGWYWLDYAIRRVARIYPPYIVAIAAVAIISAFSLSGRHMLGMYRPATEFNTGPMSWLRTLLFLFTGNDAITVGDIAIWSLRVEVALYIVAGLIAAAWFAHGAKRLLLVACLAVLTGVFCAHLTFMTIAIVLFGFGAAAALTTPALPKFSPRWGAAGIASALARPFAVVSLRDDSTISMIYQAAIGGPIALLLVLLAPSKLGERFWWTRLAIASGGWSYTLYIMHSPILIGLRTLFHDTDPNGGGALRSAAMFTLYFVLTNVICWAIALVVERPSYFAHLIRKSIALINTIPAASAASVRDE